MPPLVPFLFPALVAGSVGYVVAGLALNLVGTLVIAKIAGNMAARAQTQAYKAKWGGINVSSRGAAVPRDILYGRTRAGGTIVYMATSGAKNQYLHLVVALSSCRVKSIGAVYFGSKMAVDASGTPQDIWAGRGVEADELEASWFEDGANNLVSIDKRLGRGDQGAFAGLMAAKGADWTNAHRLQGVACVYLRLTYAPSSFPQGLPEISFDVEGCDEVVDPRTGATGYSTNPALCLAHFMAHPQFGFGTAIGASDGLNSAALIEAANICDEAVALQAGGTETRYTLNGAVSLAQDPMTTTREMLSAMAGTMADISGQFHIHAGAYRLPVKSLGLGDARGPLRITTRLSMADNFNAVRGKFISPANDWQPDDFPPYQSAVYLAEDNGERIWRDIELPYTQSASMAQRLAKIELERARRQISLPFPAQLPAWAVPVGETITLTHALRGWTNKPFVVVRSNLQLETADGPALATELTLQETSPLIYDWNATEEQIYAAAPRSNLPSAFDPPPAPAITSAVESLYSTREGAGVKTQLRVEWSASDATAVRYRLQGRQSGDWENIVTTSGQSAIIPDIAPGLWQFRLAAMTSLGVQSVWSAVWSVEVFGLLAPPAPITGAALQSVGGLAMLNWTLHPDLDVRIGGHIVVRHGNDWSASRMVAEVSGGSTQAVLSLIPGNYLLRARDSSGIVGPVTMLVSTASEAQPWSPLGSLIEDPAFAGSATGVGVINGALELDGSDVFDAVGIVDNMPRWDRPNGVATGGIYAFSTGLTWPAARRLRLRSQVDFAGNPINDVFDQRAQLVDGMESWDGISGETSVAIEIRTTPDDPTAAPIWSGWQSVISAEVVARAVQARAILTTSAPDYSPRVSTLRVTAEEII